MGTDPGPVSRPLRAALRGAGVLGMFAVAGAALVALSWQLTRERIASNEQRFLERSLNEILPSSAYDNTLYTDTLRLPAAGLGGDDGELLVYRARRQGQPVAAIFRVEAAGGYSGPITLLVGVLAGGELAGVRVVAHRETPGLGDDIEAGRSDWILAFEGKSLGAPPQEQWAVKRDGGVFDQFTGATITPRAVVQAVRNTLIYFRANRDRVFMPAPQS